MYDTQGPTDFNFVQGFAEVGLPRTYLDDVLQRVLATKDSVRTRARVPTCLPASLPAGFLPVCLLACVPVCLLAWRASAAWATKSSATVVYVASMDMPRFVNEVWPQIPLSCRLVLVTAQEVRRYVSM